MANIIYELKRESSGYVPKGGAVIFDPPLQYSSGITYDTITGEIIFDEPGLHLVKWWVATETIPLDTIEFSIALSWDGSVEYTPGCSPIKTGQVSGFGVIDVKAAGTKMSLINTTDVKAVLSTRTGATAYLLVMRINLEYSSEPIGVYHSNLTAAGSFREVTIGHVIYRIQYASSTTLAMYVRSTEGEVTVDIKRSSQVNSSYQGQSLDNFKLTTSAQSMDSPILTTSVEMHRTWIRQKDPVSGLWSLHEVQLFPSATGARVSICVYLIYENIDLSNL